MLGFGFLLMLFFLFDPVHLKQSEKDIGRLKEEVKKNAEAAEAAEGGGPDTGGVSM